MPDGVQDHFRNGLGARGAQAHAEWNKLFDAYTSKYPELTAELKNIFSGELPEGWDSDIPSYKVDAKGIASRECSGEVLTAVSGKLQWLLGSSEARRLGRVCRSWGLRFP